MKLKKGMKKFLSLALTTALVVTGANVSGGADRKVKAADENITIKKVSFSVDVKDVPAGGATIGFNGTTSDFADIKEEEKVDKDGTVEHTLVFSEDGSKEVINVGYVNGTYGVQVKVNKITVNDTYEFTASEDVWVTIAESGDPHDWAVFNIWNKCQSDKLVNADGAKFAVVDGVVKVQLPAASGDTDTSADTGSYEGAATWGIGGDKDCRIQFQNLWANPKVACPEIAGKTFTDAEITFTVSNVEKALAAAGKEKVTAYLATDQAGGVWDVGNAAATDADISADGTYTVSVDAGSEKIKADATQFLAVRIPGFDDLFDKDADGKTVAKDAATAPTFTDVKLKLTTKADATEPTPTPEAPAEEKTPYIDEALWATEGIHAYVFYQTPTWDYRNGCDPSKTKEKDPEDSYWFIKAGGSEVDGSEVVVKDVLITKDGTYTASIEGIDLSASETWNLLGISCDADTAKYPNLSITNASIAIDGTIAKEGLTLPVKPDDYRNGFYNFPAINKWNDGSADDIDPLTSSDVGLPTDSVAITFTISGLAGSTNTDVSPSPSESSDTKKATNACKKVKVAKKAYTIKKKGKTAQVVFNVTSANKKKKTTDKITTKIKNKKIAKVTKTKLTAKKLTVTVKALKKGSTVLTVKIGKKSAKAKIKVKK